MVIGPSVIFSLDALSIVVSAGIFTGGMGMREKRKKDRLELARAISKCGCNNDDASNHGTTAARDNLPPGETVEERARSHHSDLWA